MQLKNPFRILTSKDGKTWVHVPEDEADNSWWAIRKARERSRRSGRYERVTNLELDTVLITFFEGMSVELRDPEHRA